MVESPPNGRIMGRRVIRRTAPNPQQEPHRFDRSFFIRWPRSPGAAAGRLRRAGEGGGGRASYLDGLNAEQREAVEALDGPVLVLAGAGTGKTRVLTTRIAHIIAEGRARPSEILAVTFTNKAAREMKERVAMLAGPVAEGMAWLGTFHAISTKILRRHAELVGLKSSFTILDTDDQIRLLKQVLSGRKYRRQALAGARAGLSDRRLEESRPRSEARAARARRRPSPMARARRFMRSIRSG